MTRLTEQELLQALATNPDLKVEGQLSQPVVSSPQADYATEAEFQNAVIKFAREHGWEWIYHTLNSKGSEAGHLDITALRTKSSFKARGISIIGSVKAVLLECKMPGKKPTKAQLKVIDLWSRVPGVEARVVYPADWPEIERILR